ncbi:MAG: CpsD/CapB family tyrosine-protein kinase [Caulobacteraceae bacterium]
MTPQSLATRERPTVAANQTVAAPAAEPYGFSPSLVTIADPFGKAAEAIRALRTHIMAQHVQEGRRALAVCAASSGVGCTFVATNLAVALSQVGIKKLLIDADMRSPTVHRIIRPQRETDGLRQCLTSQEATFGEAIEAEVLPNLSVMYAGGASANPQELLAGERFRSLMDFCLRDFDATIIDTPAANSCSDARRVSTVVGYSLIVAGRDRSYVEDVKTLIGQLEQDHARVVGTVLNQG